MKDVIEFLELNGFVTGIASNCFRNSKCQINKKKSNYDVMHDGDTWHSNDLTIYTLIGYLTYYGLMDRNFKTT